VEINILISRGLKCAIDRDSRSAEGRCWSDSGRDGN
jgi:hypothetical protein